MKQHILAAAMALALAGSAAQASVIGTMAPPQAVSEARLAQVTTIGDSERAAWLAYLERSRALMAADKAALEAERKDGAAVPSPKQPAGQGNGMPLKQPAAWYGTAEALHVADNIVSYQTPAGGWGKNVNRSGPVRQRGELYVHSETGSSKSWSFVGTIDNDATITELRFLARVIASGKAGAGDQQRYERSFALGLNYLFNAQYPNGGFPQVYPLAGGYHDAITFNDNALANTVELLDDVARRDDDYAFVAPQQAARAAAARDRAENVIMATQIRLQGVLTAWCQQHDALTLAPVGARNFEPVALTSFESARLLAVLMRDPAPTPAVVTAVSAGAAWLQRTAIYDKEWTRGKDGASLMSKPGAGPLWARMYDLDSMQPIFGDRDRTIHTDVNELSPERRAGYAWYVNSPASTLQKYARWSTRHKAKS
ncbi:MAG: pectate lyase [Duganella sp.]